MMDDATLLRHFASDRSEAAFAELVRRHLNLVYSVALRKVGGDVHFAEDATQNVFSALAHHAASLANRPVLTGWLYTTAHFTAAKIVRTERRRQQREHEAQAMQQFHSDPTPEADWDRLRPMLDDVMHALNGRDREAILLRFFEGRPFAEVGAKLGLNENSARMRVDRALDKLRALLARRGVTSTTAALSLLLANQAVVAAPASLAATVTSTAVAGVATATGGGVLAFLQLMSASKTVAGLAGAMVIAIGTGVIVQQQATARLREEVASLQQIKTEIAPLRAGNQRLAQAADEVPSLRRDHAEVVQLRADVAVAKQKLAAVAKTPAVRNRNTSTIRNGVPDDNLDQGKETGVPKVISQVAPVYPMGLRMDGETGEVTVRIIVDTNGDVQDASVLKSSDPDLSAAALAAVKQWKFSPPSRNGRPVKVRLQETVIFNLADD